LTVWVMEPFSEVTALPKVPFQLLADPLSEGLVSLNSS